ncbi:unnamed protein product, partial [Adineta steineri]
NWTTSDYDFACEGNQALPNVSMLCRHDFIQCLSTEVTNRYVPSDCVDTPNWTNLVIGTPTHKGWSCLEYEFIHEWCAGGTFTLNSQWTLGKGYNFPELNCCACGKGSQTPYKLVDISPKNSSTIPADLDIIDLYNCIASPKPNNLRFNFKCLGPSNFTKINTTANTTLYNCPINCFFDRNRTTIDMIQSVNVTRQQTGINATYYLISNLFPNFQVICGIDNTQFPTLPPTSSEVDDQLFSSLEPIVDQDTSETPTTNTLLSPVGSSSFKATTYTEETITIAPPVESSSFKAATYAGETTTTASLIGSGSLKATTYAQEITTTALIAFVTTATLPPSPVWQSPTCANGNIGLNCNVSVDLCQITNPCINNGTCVNTLSSSYTCTCMQGFTGSHCETDIRPCKPWTCLSYGLCNETSPTTFQCECYPGYEGLNCESLTDYCDDIICQNNGQCRPILLNFTCECTTKDVTGRFCEVKSNSLVIKAAIKRSVGYIAIIAIVGVISIFVGLDALTYIFKIDTVKRHRRYLARRRRQQRERQSKPKLVVHFVYVNASPDESTIEA